MKNIYLVEASSGSYDDYGTVVVKCFENKQDAEIYSEKYDKVIRKISDFHNDAWSVVTNKDYDNEESYESCFHHSIWSKYNYKFSGYNGVKVIEMPIVEHRRTKNLKDLLN